MNSSSAFSACLAQVMPSNSHAEKSATDSKTINVSALNSSQQHVTSVDFAASSYTTKQLPLQRKSHSIFTPLSDQHALEDKEPHTITKNLIPPFKCCFNHNYSRISPTGEKESTHSVPLHAEGSFPCGCVYISHVHISGVSRVLMMTRYTVTQGISPQYLFIYLYYEW